MMTAADLRVGDHIRYLSTTWCVTALHVDGYDGLVDIHLASGNQKTSVLLASDEIVEVR